MCKEKNNNKYAKKDTIVICRNINKEKHQRQQMEEKSNISLD